MIENKLYNTFEKDTNDFINHINESLIKLENDGYSAEEINHIFRCIHSIKSEAAYLKLEEISSAAHDMESAIEPLRNVGTAVEVDPALIEFCFATIDKIGALAIETLIQDEEEEEVETELEEVFDDEPAVDLSLLNQPYTEFEIMLIREAMARGEKIFSLKFGISDDEAMKYPRAYLAVSNLEQLVNVIKVSPSPEAMDESNAETITIILTAEKSEEQIIDELNIDQIINLKILELSYVEELKNEPIEDCYDLEIDAAEDDRIVLSHDRIISVEAGEIDAISDYVGEIKKRLADLSAAVLNETSENNLGNDLAGLEMISNSIESMMSNLQTVDFNSHFAGFRRTVRDLASELGKKTELAFDNENIRIQRDFAEFISEPLLQLIRNAVVHGIEMPDQRTSAGKAEIGAIKIKAFKAEDSLIISITDDGRGIDKTALSSEYGNISTDEQLIELLTQPGYTTLVESKQFGGRGVGLDLVANKIKTRNGCLELINRAGFGCEFRLIFHNFH